MPTFGANLTSPKLRFKQADFFIKIRGYGRDTNWADVIKKTADNAVNLIRKHWPSEDVLFEITEGVKEANMYPLDIQKRCHTGILRIKRSGWECDSGWEGCELGTNYGASGHFKYKPYEERLDEVRENPLPNPFDNFDLTRPKIGIGKEKYLSHGNANCINVAFEHIDKIYRNLQKYYIERDVHKQHLPDINAAIAQIRWIMAHATPWERGSDSISNVFMRALYKAMGIKSYPAAKGISFDLEAYCRDLDDYKMNFTSFFEKAPEVIE